LRQSCNNSSHEFMVVRGMVAVMEVLGMAVVI